MDVLTRALSKKTGIRLVYVDVTESARQLEQRHLAGPVAAELLARGLASVALLSVDQKADEEAFSLQLGVDGPLGGLLVEAWGAGQLRGYTNRKVLPDFDGIDGVDPSDALGGSGLMTVIHSRPDAVLYSGTIAANPPDLRLNLARYCNKSQQTPTAVEIHSEATEQLVRATGVIVQKLPDGDTESFVTALERFNAGAVRDALAEAASPESLGPLLGLDDLEILETKPLRFGCRCSEEKVAGAMALLPADEVRELIAAGEAQEVICHYCGKTYHVSPEALRELVRDPAEGN